MAEEQSNVIKFVERRGALLTPREAGIHHIMETVELLLTTIEVHRETVPEAMDVHASVDRLREVLAGELGPWRRRMR
jgi:hypothetical protein